MYLPHYDVFSGGMDFRLLCCMLEWGVCTCMYSLPSYRLNTNIAATSGLSGFHQKFSACVCQLTFCIETWYSNDHTLIVFMCVCVLSVRDLRTRLMCEVVYLLAWEDGCFVYTRDMIWVVQHCAMSIFSRNSHAIGMRSELSVV